MTGAKEQPSKCRLPPITLCPTPIGRTKAKPLSENCVALSRCCGLRRVWLEFAVLQARLAGVMRESW